MVLVLLFVWNRYWRVLQNRYVITTEGTATSRKRSTFDLVPLPPTTSTPTHPEIDNMFIQVARDRKFKNKIVVMSE